MDTPTLVRSGRNRTTRPAAGRPRRRTVRHHGKDLALIVLLLLLGTPLIAIAVWLCVQRPAGWPLALLLCAVVSLGLLTFCGYVLRNPLDDKPLIPLDTTRPDPPLAQPISEGGMPDGDPA